MDQDQAKYGNLGALKANEPTLVAELKQQFKIKLRELQKDRATAQHAGDFTSVQQLSTMQTLLELNWDALELALKMNDLHAFCEAARNQIAKTGEPTFSQELQMRIIKLQQDIN